MAAPGRRFFISSPLPAIRLSGAKVVMLTGGRLASAAASSAAIASAVVITGWAELAAAWGATLAVVAPEVLAGDTGAASSLTGDTFNPGTARLQQRAVSAVFEDPN